MANELCIDVYDDTICLPDNQDVLEWLPKILVECEQHGNVPFHGAKVTFNIPNENDYIETTETNFHGDIHKYGNITKIRYFPTMKIYEELIDRIGDYSNLVCSYQDKMIWIRRKFQLVVNRILIIPFGEQMNRSLIIRSSTRTTLTKQEWFSRQGMGRNDSVIFKCSRANNDNLRSY